MRPTVFYAIHLRLASGQWSYLRAIDFDDALLARLREQYEGYGLGFRAALHAY